jgi:hypothetical protein
MTLIERNKCNETVGLYVLALGCGTDLEFLTDGC